MTELTLEQRRALAMAAARRRAAEAQQQQPAPESPGLLARARDRLTLGLSDALTHSHFSHAEVPRQLIAMKP